MDSVNDKLTNIYEDILDSQPLQAITIFFIVVFGAFFFKTVLVVSLHSLRNNAKESLLRIFSEEFQKVPLAFFIVLGLYISALTLDLSSDSASLFDIVQIIFALFILFFGVRLINRTINRYTVITSRDLHDKSLISAYLYASLVIRAIVWVLGAIIVFSNVGYDLSAVIAGLGISGFAVAFAFRNIIKDILGSFIILFDKPIEVGDYIEVDKYSGIVKQIGIKSTRIKTDDGYEAIVPNTMIVDKSLKNYRSHATYYADFEVTLEHNAYKQYDIYTILKEEVLNAFEYIKDDIKVVPQYISPEESSYIISMSVSKLRAKEGMEKVQNVLMHHLYKVLKQKRIPVKKITLMK